MKKAIEVPDLDTLEDVMNNNRFKIHNIFAISTIGTSNYNTKGNYEHQYSIIKYIVIYSNKKWWQF